jgi:hypothetical protein
MPEDKDRPKPYMWVEKQKSIRLDKHYMELQYPQLTKLIGSPETVSIFYPIASIRELIKLFPKNYGFLQITIASYDDNAQAPTTQKKKLTLLFSSSDTVDNPREPYYSLDSANKFVVDPNAATWIKQYQTIKVPRLIDNLDKTATENQTSVSYKISDTMRISHEASHITELLNEIDHQDLLYPSQKIIGLTAFFASYTATDHPEGYNSAVFVNRLFPLFEFTVQGASGSNEILYLDDRPGYLGRPKASGIPTVKNMVGVNNGHLCPPGCP